MPLVSFSGKPEGLPPFWLQILQGRKTQTCRKPRKRPIRKGDKLFLYWKCRVSPSYVYINGERKPVHKIGEAVRVNEPNETPYEDFAFDDEFAKVDGFKDHNQLQLWFGMPIGQILEEEWDVIKFELKTQSMSLQEYEELVKKWG